MANKTIKSNTPQTKATDVKKSKVWLGDDGVVRIKIGGAIDEKIIETLVKDFREISKELPTKTKVLINIGLTPHTRSSVFRKKVVRVIRDAFRELELAKVAIWGGGAIQGVVALFIITAARLKNIKYFKTEKEAIRWLKE